MFKKGRNYFVIVFLFLMVGITPYCDGPSVDDPVERSECSTGAKKIDTDPETGQVIRELRLMVYSAQCPVCSARVEVESGGFEFPFRLVGRCIESPKEHVFSFDHVTRTGSPLRVS